MHQSSVLTFSKTNFRWRLYTSIYHVQQCFCFTVYIPLVLQTDWCQQLCMATSAPLPLPQRRSRRLRGQKPLSPSRQQVEEEWSGVSPTHMAEVKDTYLPTWQRSKTHTCPHGRGQRHIPAHMAEVKDTYLPTW